MCCRQECEDRQNSGEVSIFETTADTVNASFKQRRIDPLLAVSKYRRSAAGHTTHYPPRSLSQANLTVDHLIRILVTQKPPSSAQALSLMNAIQFFEDRARALQVDLVKSQVASKRIQSRLARCHLLILYLVADEPTYAEKFGQTALRTALSSYWYQPQEESMDDEMFSYMVLNQCSESLRQEQSKKATGESLTSSALSLYRKYMPLNAVVRMPLFQWTLQLTARTSLGHWQVALRMLYDKEGTLPAHFGVLVRCCFAKALPYIRWKAMQAYNASFRKAEPVPFHEVARLLHICDRRNDDGSETVVTSATVALELGQASGLPEEGGALIFKAGSIKELSATIPARDDAFILAVEATEWKTTSRASWDEDSSSDPKQKVARRRDADNILVPPTDLMVGIIVD